MKEKDTCEVKDTMKQKDAKLLGVGRSWLNVCVVSKHQDNPLGW